MDPIVVIAEEQHYGSLHVALDSVAREKRFLAATEAPPFDRSVTFYRELADRGMAHYVALDGERVVGWVDVAGTFGQARAHIGLLGIGLIKEAHHQGLGRRLMEAAIAHSWKQGLSRIELTVRADNLNAKKLYERLGFEREGVMRRGCCVDGHYFDMHFMALLRNDEWVFGGANTPLIRRAFLPPSAFPPPVAHGGHRFGVLLTFRAVVLE